MICVWINTKILSFLFFFGFICWPNLFTLSHAHDIGTDRENIITDTKEAKRAKERDDRRQEKKTGRGIVKLIRRFLEIEYQFNLFPVASFVFFPSLGRSILFYWHSFLDCIGKMAWIASFYTRWIHENERAERCKHWYHLIYVQCCESFPFLRFLWINFTVFRFKAIHSIILKWAKFRVILCVYVVCVKWSETAHDSNSFLFVTRFEEKWYATGFKVHAGKRIKKPRKWIRIEHNVRNRKQIYFNWMCVFISAFDNICPTPFFQSLFQIVI